MPARCICFDRIIETDIPIPGAIALAAPGRSEATIRIGQPIAGDLSPPDVPIWSVLEGDLVFMPPGVARYRCGARSVTVTPDPSAASGDVVGLLIATALPAMLWLDGAFVLHAAAVVPAGEDRALAIAGPSGIGKSRLAAALLRKGARLVADDSVAVRVVDDRAICSGLAGGYHLGADGEADRQFHRLAPDAMYRSAPLGAIAILDDKERPSRLRAVSAVEALLANRHRPNAARHAGLEPRSLADAAFLARTVPVYTWPADNAYALLDEGTRRMMTEMGNR